MLVDLSPPFHDIQQQQQLQLFFHCSKTPNFIMHTLKFEILPIVGPMNLKWGKRHHVYSRLFCAPYCRYCISGPRSDIQQTSPALNSLLTINNALQHFSFNHSTFKDPNFIPKTQNLKYFAFLAPNFAT